MSFDDLVGQSVAETLSKILGTDTWKAINFFFDVNGIAREPETFAAVLDKFFGFTSNVLQRRIGGTLLARGGAVQQTLNSLKLRPILRLAKTKFSTQPLPEQLRPQAI